MIASSMQDLSSADWEDFVRRWSPALYRLAYRLARNPFDAEDLAQEVLLRLYRARERMYLSENPIPLLNRILINLFRDRWRRTRHLLAVPLEEERDKHGDEAVDPVDHQNPADLAETRETQAEVRKALSKLPEFAYEIIALHDLQGLTYEEIAVVLDIPLGTVRSRLHRARKRLVVVLRSQKGGIRL